MGGPATSSESVLLDQDRRVRTAAMASVAVAIILLVTKLGAWAISGSVSLLASLVDSAMDALASLMNFLAVRYAMQPADDEHRFGHGKAESLAGLIQALLIAASAIFLFWQGIQRLASPQPLLQLDAAIAVMVFSMLLTTALVAYQHRVVKLTGSVAIKADALHYSSDLLTNAGVLLALILSLMGWAEIDAWVAMAIAGYILYSAGSIAFESVQALLDRELSEARQADIVRIATAIPGVVDVHGLRTRQSGRTLIIQLHLDLPGNLSLWEAHEICDEVERGLLQRFPDADVLLHQDPVRA